MHHRVPHRLPLGDTGPIGFTPPLPGPTGTESEPGRVVAIDAVPVERRWSPRVHAAANTPHDRGGTAHERSEDAADADRDTVVRGHTGRRTRPRHPRAARRWRTANIRAMLAP